MRVLNTKTLQLSEYFEKDVPTYAILSHTWGDDEVTYQHIQSFEQAQKMKGFVKVKGACELAARECFTYIWIDTCCIDKSSSAELSEAINSMYAWYEKSAKCYAYLADVDYLELPEDTGQFAKSRWFTRGWTLQELIAPRQVTFYSRNWVRLGAKSELCKLLSTITGIDIGILAGGDHQSVSVARKMFWASARETKRTEDMAYCLLGLFSVNMPLMYGEGRNSFIRLQEEIIKIYDDQSIFAWTIPAAKSSPNGLHGLLAKSPDAFSETGKHISGLPSKYAGRRPTRITNTGIDVDLLLQPQNFFFGLIGNKELRHASGNDYKKHHWAILDCGINSHRNTVMPCIEVVALGSHDFTGQASFARIRPWVLKSEDLWLAVTPPTFMNYGNSYPETWPFSGFIQSCALRWEALWLQKIPWEFREISVSHEPRKFLPLGFRLTTVDPIRVIEVNPAKQWLNYDHVLRRRLPAPKESLGCDFSSLGPEMAEEASYADVDHEDIEKVITEVDGVLRLEVSVTELYPPRSEEPNSTGSAASSIQFGHIGLVLGMRSTHRPFDGDWDQSPWCRFITLKYDENLPEFDSHIDGEVSDVDAMEVTSSCSVVAELDRLNSNGLYDVQLSLYVRG